MDDTLIHSSPHPWISSLFREGSPVPIYTDGLKHCRSKVSRLRTHQSDLASAWTKLPDPGSRTSPIIEYWINSPDYGNAWWRLPLTAAAYKLCPLFRNKLACKYNINETVCQAPQKQVINMWLIIREGRSSTLNPLTPMNDQDRISPYNINTISTR